MNVRAVCIKAAALRHHSGTDNVKVWLDDPDHVYAGRAMRIFVHWRRPLRHNESLPPGAYLDKNGNVVERVMIPNSLWNNPFKVGRDGTLEQVLERYSAYLAHRLDTEPALVTALHGLANKTLGCWCDDVRRCHTAVVIDAFEQRCT